MSECFWLCLSGVRINLDNLQEVDRVAKLFDQHPELVTSSDTAAGTASSGSSSSGSLPRIIGIRNNPQVGVRDVPSALVATGRGHGRRCCMQHVLSVTHCWRQPKTGTEDGHRGFNLLPCFRASSYTVQLVWYLLRWARAASPHSRRRAGCPSSGCR